MSKASETITEKLPVRDALFAEVGLLTKMITPEVIQKGQTVLEEMGKFGISRGLASLLVERKLIDRKQEKEVLRELSRIALTCPRCKKSLPLEEMGQEGQVRCPQCKNMCLVSWRKGSEGKDHDRKLEDRLKVEILGGSEAARVGQARAAPGLAKPGSSVAKSSPAGGGSPQVSGAAPPPASGRKDAPRPRDAKAEKGRSSASPEPAPAPAEPKAVKPRVNVRRTIKKYRILSVLSNGPHGRVYLARSRTSQGEGEVVVLKVLSTGQPDRKSVGALKERLQAWKDLNAESPDPPHALETEESLLYVVRPFLGDSCVALSDFRAENPAQKGQILKCVAEQLKAIHALGGVHGNLKPSNIFIRKKDSRIYLVDPALHLLLPRSDRLARWRLLADSPQYVSPEDIDGDEASPASDVYSLGWVFYSLLAGSPPFKDLAPPEVLRAHQVGPCPELPPELGGWGMLHTAMTALETRERPRDAADVLQQVEAILAGRKPVLAAVTPRPAPPPDELEFAAVSRRFSFRYAVGPVVLLLALAWVGWCYKSWRNVREDLSAPNQNLLLFNRLAQHAYVHTSAEVRAEPEHGRELWEKYLKLFSGSPLADSAQRELKAYQPVKPPPKR